MLYCGVFGEGGDKGFEVKDNASFCPDRIHPVEAGLV